MSQNNAIIDAARSRYSCKAFDPSKKISDADFEQLKEIMRLSPSSVNSQPWHFIVTNSEEGKARVAKGTQGPLAFNEGKVLNASHVIVYCVKTGVDDAYLDQILAQEEKDGRFADPKVKVIVNNARMMFSNIHRNELNDVTEWFEKQVYINLGSLLLAAGAMGIDAVPMEGVDVDALNAEFGLDAKGLRAVVVVGLGYHSDQDFNAVTPKSRLSEDVIFTNV